MSRLNHGKAAASATGRAAAHEGASEGASLPRRTGAQPTRAQWRRLRELAEERGERVPRGLSCATAEALIRRWQRERREGSHESTP